jgi:hypothetical protein
LHHLLINNEIPSFSYGMLSDVVFFSLDSGALERMGEEFAFCACRATHLPEARASTSDSESEGSGYVRGPQILGFWTSSISYLGPFDLKICNVLAIVDVMWKSKPR